MIKKSKKLNFDINKIEVFFFDFDGVLTNNLVFVDQNGKETVVCNRSDGLGLKYLQKIKKKIFIISSEKNKVVSQRARKLKVTSFTGVKNKLIKLIYISKKYKLDLNKSVYIGNDINDYEAMMNCKIKICPKDSHRKIISISDHILDKKGGEGIVIELIEKVFNENIVI